MAPLAHPLSLLLAAAPLAAPPPGEPPAIYGGQAASTCQWPQAVALYDGGNSQLCSAALIHPQIAVYAAHCGTGFSTLRLGEDVTAPAIKAELAGCYAHPEVDGTPARDFAYCRLAAPILEVPLVPPLVGCETELLAPGAPMTLVGFGEIEGGSAGDKNWVDVAIDTYPFMESLILAGGDGLGTCKWDSGAPGYVALADGTWRTAGVTYGTTLTCGAGTVLIPLFGFLGWLEEHSGIDVTPCHDADGTWNPDGRCDHLATDPGLGGGSWDERCPGPLGGPGAACGDPYTATPDDSPPTVMIAEPADGSVFPGPSLDLVALVDADDGEGWGLDEVSLAVNGQESPPLALPPFAYALSLPEGTWTLVASARDYAGLEGSSRPVVITVGEPAAATTSDGGSAGETSAASEGSTAATATSDPPDTSGDTTDSSASATSGSAAETDSGCACAAEGPRAPTSLLALILVVSRRRRGKTSAR
ncbi:MAG: trypsin-like serine protease [Myxococcales bacterium]|nr:trypsin-like serine protease [Myxococcales bacterium]